MSKPRVLMADDHALVAEGIRRILETEFEVVGAVEDGRALVSSATTLQPDLVLLDISMPLLNGYEAARQIRRASPDTKILFLSMHSDVDYVREAFRAGASGYLLKRAVPSELVVGIREVLAGKRYVTPLLAKVIAPVPESAGPHESLTPRQREVLQLVAEGLTAKEIANELGISTKTVEFHKASIMEALKLRTIAELTRYALERGMVGH